MHPPLCRRTLAGYRVVTVALRGDGTAEGVRPFMSGLLAGDTGLPACPATPKSNQAAVRGGVRVWVWAGLEVLHGAPEERGAGEGAMVRVLRKTSGCVVIHVW